MKRHSLSSVIALVLTLSMALAFATAGSAAAAGTPVANSYPVDADQSTSKDDILSIYNYGGLNGLVDADGNFNPNAICSTRDFATILANLFGTKYINPSSYSTAAITQGVACDLMTQLSRQLGHGVGFSNVTADATVDRGTACMLIVMMLDSNSALKSLILNASPIDNSSPQGVHSFTDVPVDSWYANAVAWAVNNGIAQGVTDTSFGHDQVISVAEMYYLLWRSNKSPASAADCLFGGIASNNSYYAALCWAGKQGIVSNDRIDPLNTPATRSDMLWCLWKLNGSPYAYGNLAFTDIPSNASYATAARWGVKNGIISGTSNTTFDPLGKLVRAAAVTMLYRCYQGVNYAGYNGVPSSDSNANYYYYKGERFQTNIWYQYNGGWLYNGEWSLTHK